MKLPQSVATSLAKAVGAYLRDVPANEVPPGLKRFRGFRPQALTPHRAKLIAAIEDEDFRDDIAEWLKDSPRLSKEEKRILTIAVERRDGWEEALERSAPAKKAPVRTESERLREALQRERDRVSRLKEDLRSQRESSRRELQATRQRASESNAEVRALKVQVRAAEAEARSLRQEFERGRRSAEKEGRGLRRDAERALGARDEADRRLASLKRRVAALERQRGELERQLVDLRAKADRARRTQKPVPQPGPRRTLPVPKGLLDDAPETLRAWLSSDGVRLIVDGYNVGKASKGFPDVELEVMRNRVVDEIAKLARKHSVPAAVVFDGAEVQPGTARRTRGPVKIQYSKPGTSADDHIVDLVRGPSSDPVVVVTNDRELQRRVGEHRATVATSDQLLSLIR